MYAFYMGNHTITIADIYMILTDKLLSSVFSLKKALAAAIASTINVAVIKLKRKKKQQLFS